MASWRSTMAPPSARTAVSPLAVATGCFSAAIRAAKRLRCCEASSRLATAAVLSPSPGSATCCPEFRRTPSRGLVNYCPTAGNRSLVQPRSELRLYHSIHALEVRFTSRLKTAESVNINASRHGTAYVISTAASIADCYFIWIQIATSLKSSFLEFDKEWYANTMPDEECGVFSFTCQS